MAPNTKEVLDREWLTIRARLIEVAAALDRIDRAEGVPPDDARSAQIAESLRVLAHERENRAERLQMVFSLPYEPQWRERYGV